MHAWCIPSSPPYRLTPQTTLFQDKFGRDSPGPLGYKVSMTYKGITLLSGKGGRGVSFTKGPKDARPASTGDGQRGPPLISNFFLFNSPTSNSPLCLRLTACPLLPSTPLFFFGVADLTPGPNTYKVRESMGSQMLSSTPSAARVPKSTMERDQWSKVFISSSHTKFDAGVDSPGPAYMPESNARGGDTLGLGKAKGNGWSFPKQPQRPSTVASMRSPGPGKSTRGPPFDCWFP